MAYIYSARELIEREIVDVIQPDVGRFGGLTQMIKFAGMAKAHYIQVAPHDGSLGPVGEIASIYLCAVIPDFLIWEHRTDDAPLRYEVMQPQPEVVDGDIIVPNTHGLGIDLVDEVIEAHPHDQSRACRDSSRDAELEFAFIRAQRKRASWPQGQDSMRPFHA